MSRSSKGSNVSPPSTDFFVTENMFLTKKNAELTHMLEDMKMKCRDLGMDRTHLQRENMELIFQVRLLTAKLNTINDKMKRILPGYSSITETLSDVILESQISTGLPRVSATRCPESPFGNKVQQAVKPMVSGHVIDSPVIVMKRLKDLDRIAANSSRRLQNIEEIETPNLEDNERTLTTSEAEGEVAETTETPTADPLLSTIQEESTSNAERYTSEMELHTSSSNAALISGIFSAVNVYVTPLQALPSLSPRIARQLATGRKRTSVYIESPLPSTSRNEAVPSTSSASTSLSPQITKRKRKNLVPVIQDSSEDSASPSPEDRRTEEARAKSDRLSRFPNFLNIDAQPFAQSSNDNEEERKIQTLQMLGLSPKMKTKFATSTPNIRPSTSESTGEMSSITSNGSKGPSSTPIKPVPTIVIERPSVRTKRGKTTIDNSNRFKRRSDNDSSRLSAQNQGDLSTTSTLTISPRKPGRPSKGAKMPTCKVMVKRLSLPKRRSRSPDKNEQNGEAKSKKSKRSSEKQAPSPMTSPKRPVGRPPRSAKPTSGSLKEKPLNKKQRREK